MHFISQLLGHHAIVELDGDPIDLSGSMRNSVAAAMLMLSIAVAGALQRPVPVVQQAAARTLNPRMALKLELDPEEAVRYVKTLEPWCCSFGHSVSVSMCVCECMGCVRDHGSRHSTERLGEGVCVRVCVCA